MIAAVRARRLARLALSLFLVAMAIQGAINVARNIGSLETANQVAMTIAQAAYVLLSLPVVVGLWRGASWSLTLALCWVIAFLAAVALILPAWVPAEQAGWPRYALGSAGVGLIVLSGVHWSGKP